jgi:AraC-like DNA-binding protein
VRTLARELATSASTLTRAFRGEYGVSIGEFVRQARVRLIVTGLREPQASIKLLAAQAGFASRTSLYAALMHYAGLTPTQVRSLSVAEFDSLLSMLTPVGKPSERRGSRRFCRQDHQEHGRGPHDAPRGAGGMPHYHSPRSTSASRPPSGASSSTPRTASPVQG